MHHAPKALRAMFDELMHKLDRVRTDEKRLVILKEADDLLRNNLYGWDAVHLHPPKGYKLRAYSRRRQPVSPLASEPTVYVPSLNGEITLTTAARNALRTAIRTHPLFVPGAKGIELWRKVELMAAARELHIDVLAVVAPHATPLPSTPIEQAIADSVSAEPPAPPVLAYVPPVDGDPESVEYKGYAVELSARENLSEDARQYFKLVARLSRSLTAHERDRVIEFYTAPNAQ